MTTKLRCFGTTIDDRDDVTIITAQVSDTNHQRSPLAQGGLEIPIELSVSWTDFTKVGILRQKMLSMNFVEYIDESEEILEAMGVSAANDDTNVEHVNLHENVAECESSLSSSESDTSDTSDSGDSESDPGESDSDDEILGSPDEAGEDEEFSPATKRYYFEEE